MTIRITVTNIITCKNKILLGKQKPNNAKIQQFLDEWTIPCGTMGRETIEECSLRELKEETTLSAKNSTMVDAYALKFTKNNQTYHTVAIWMHVVVKSTDAEPKDDLQQLCWVNMTELDKYITSESKIYTLMSQKIRDFLHLK